MVFVRRRYRSNALPGRTAHFRHGPELSINHVQRPLGSAAGFFTGEEDVVDKAQLARADAVCRAETIETTAAVDVVSTFDQQIGKFINYLSFTVVDRIERGSGGFNGLGYSINFEIADPGTRQRCAARQAVFVSHPGTQLVVHKNPYRALIQRPRIHTVRNARRRVVVN